mmetsp:Transcript_6562/g.22467  ORF Transcript_6562/g.22467 Transcript_6562/m.22467 type:complete len:322 (+) Transcript_6562:1155-2120(+)
MIWASTSAPLRGSASGSQVAAVPPVRHGLAVAVRSVFPPPNSVHAESDAERSANGRFGSAGERFRVPRARAPMSVADATMAEDITGDGVVDEHDLQLFKHHDLDEHKYMSELYDKQAPQGLGHLFAQGGGVLRERVMATWMNTSLLTALFMTITIPSLLEPPDIEDPVLLNVFVSCNGVAVVAQVMGLYLTMQLVVHMDRVMGACGAAAYMSYPQVLNIATVAYSLSYGINIVATLASIAVAAAGLYDWQGLAIPAIFLTMCVAFYIFALVRTNRAHTFADRVVVAATRRAEALRGAEGNQSPGPEGAARSSPSRSKRLMG